MLRYFACLLLVSVTSNVAAPAQSPNRETALKEFESLRTQMKTLESALLEVSGEDRAAFAEFLKQPDTGLIRLLPREKYDGKLQIRGGGAYYSFARLTHEYGYGSDISFEQGSLSIGFAGANYGLLAKVSKIPLEELTLETPAIQVLAQFKPPTTLPEARLEQRKSSDGTTIDGVLYKNRLTALVDNIYVLRSINYDSSDILAAFKIVREDTTDGSLILAWRLLRKYPTPRLDRDSIREN